MPTLSGPAWTTQFPTSIRTSALLPAFAANVDSFVDALRAARIRVAISATLRPPERAYLMHYCYRIARDLMDPATVPPINGVDIQWTHVDAQGAPDLKASRNAARHMMTAYAIVYRPALASRHTEGRAVDMSISSYVGRSVADAEGTAVLLKTASQLHALGASFGVYKLASDPPHWSDDGH